MADAPDLGSGSERIGGSSPLARTMVSGLFEKRVCFDDRHSGMKKSAARKQQEKVEFTLTYKKTKALD